MRVNEIRIASPWCRSGNVQSLLHYKNPITSKYSFRNFRNRFPWKWRIKYIFSTCTKLTWLRTVMTGTFIFLTIWKKKQEKNSTISIIKSLRILIFRTLASKCGKIISRKLVLRVATQLKARFLHKATENQPARESQINVKFYVMDHKIRQNWFSTQ